MEEQAYTARRIGSVRPRVDKPVLKLTDFLTSSVPPHPIAVDNTVTATGPVDYGLDHNDVYGVCVPTGLDNLRRMVTQLLTGAATAASWTDIIAWYKTQNPDFDENDPEGPGDQGMVIQDFLAWAVKQGLILGFAEVDPRNDDELQAAIYLFLGLQCGAVLSEAQQTQTDEGTWDYVAGSPDWGGHCFVTAAYEAGQLVDVITWDERVRTTAPWRRHQLSEAYVVLLPAHLDHPDFRAGFDLQKFADAYEQLTGRPFPDYAPPVTPPITPPGPPSFPGLEPAARALAADPEVASWLTARHVGRTKRVAAAVSKVVAALGVAG